MAPLTRTLAAAAVLVALTNGCKRDAERNDQPSASSSSAQPQVPTTATLPPEPPPSVPEKASEVPALEAAIAASPSYQAIWSAPRPELNAFLTYVSEITFAGGAPRPLGDALEAKKLKDPAVKVMLVFARTARFPADFTAKFAAHLSKTRSEPHQGTWSVMSKGDAAHDYTALAAWSQPRDATLLRERLQAKSAGAGPFPWSPSARATRPWLTDESSAIERLGLLAPLTASEQSRLAVLKAEAARPRAPKLGEDFRLGDFTYNVKSVEVVEAVGTGLAKKNASAGAQFVLANFTIRNDANETLTVITDDFRVIDGRGREFRPSSEANAALVMSGGKDLAITELQPGLTKKMTTAFEMPEDAAKGTFTLVVPEKGLLGTSVVRITLR